MAERWDGYSAGDGADMFGRPLNNEPVPAEFASLYPAGTPGIAAAPGKLGHEQLPKQSLVEEPPDKRGKRKRRKVKSPETPPPYRTTKSKPGGEQIDRSGPVQQGK